ncbi:MAG: CRTAC1 family protein, partial [Planctomycetota bacterium]
ETRSWNQGDIHVGWIDADNDGRLDLLIASSDYPDDQFLRLFRQKADHTFTDATDAAGFAWRNPTGISLGDYDRDGRTDILVGNNNMRLQPEQRKGRVLEAALFRNRAARRNHFLTVRLEGKGAGGANRMGIGARIEVEIEGRTLVREIYGGGGHCGQQNPPEAHFGLGPAERVRVLRVRWPNRAHTVQTFRDVEADAFLRIREGATGVEVERRVPRPLPAEEEPQDREAEEEEEF